MHRISSIEKAKKKACFEEKKNMKNQREGDEKVLPVGRRELRGAPAGDGLAHELLGRDETGEADEEHDCVLSCNSVAVVVIFAKLYLANAQQ